MKKLIFGAGVAALLAAAGLPAQAAEQQIVIGATVTGSCTIDGSAVGAGSATIAITSGNVVTTPIVKTYPVACNAPATAELKSSLDGLSGPAAASGFDNHINYAASTTGFVAIAATATTSGATAPHTLGTGTTASASATPVNVTITPQANANPLVAGSYSDTLVLTINPT
jgi:hypothetical protein